jgi:uncharacterized UPF0160 family protein
MKRFIRGVTHAGKPHLDECMTTAILQYLYGEFPIERKDVVTQKEFTDPTIIVFDVGGRFNTALHCYDHHQSENLRASCYLVWKTLAPHATLEERFIKNQVIQQLLYGVSDEDRGFFDRTKDIVSINKAFSMIVHLYENTDEAFAEGVRICELVLRGLVKKLVDRITLEKDWKERKKVFGPGGSIAYIEKTDKKFLPDEWKFFAKEEGIKLIILPNSRITGFSLYSINGINIPFDKKQTTNEFGKKACYKSLDAAQNAAIEIMIAKTHPKG